ncbi:hypothetical protein HY449_02350 [Candidatus Pacearchaeota archaeon]|nr:hypothetical protein [Candidatus Pacearchaeota archaeon]
MKKNAKDLKKGDKVKVAGTDFVVEETEISDIGKHGKRKVRIVASNDKEKLVIIRPDDYPFEIV